MISKEKLEKWNYGMIEEALEVLRTSREGISDVMQRMSSYLNMNEGGECVLIPKDSTSNLKAQILAGKLARENTAHEQCIKFVKDAVETINLLGSALADHNHQWSPTERAAYDSLIKLSEKFQEE